MEKELSWSHDLTEYLLSLLCLLPDCCVQIEVMLIKNICIVTNI